MHNNSNLHSQTPSADSQFSNLWRVKIIPTNDFEYCSPPSEITVQRGDHVVVSTRYGLDLGRILGPVNGNNKICAEQIRQINRIATEEDLERREENSRREKDAFDICRKKIDHLGLAMKLVAAHYILGENKLMFFFTAENRIDFRALVKELVAQFKMRIELRQIGVRDSSRALGGVSVCGRTCCCSSVTDKLQPVSIRMAKEQNLSLNSQKISGPCGRLMCCLGFEYAHYCNERKQMPGEGTRIVNEGISYKVTEVNIFSRTVQMAASEGRFLEIPSSQLSRKDDGSWAILSSE